MWKKPSFPQPRYLRFSIALLLFIVFIAFALDRHSRAQDKSQKCEPKVTVDCPKSIKAGKKFLCTARVSNSPNGATISYKWETNPQTEFTGGDTDRIEVSTEAPGAINIVATVNVKAAECPAKNEATIEVLSTGEPMLAGGFSSAMPRSTQRRQLDIAAEMVTAGRRLGIVSGPGSQELVDFAKDYLGKTHKSVQIEESIDNSKQPGSVRLFVLTAGVTLPTPRDSQNNSTNQQPNGISVGRPKVFDNRTLTLMLESLNDSLRTVQNSFINKETLAAAFSFLQGYQARETSRSLSITGNPIPSLTDVLATTTAANKDVSTVDTKTKTQAAITPSAPTLNDATSTIPGFNPTFGQNPGDLLSDQVNLTYQIFNLRMLLERSLSDRLLDNSEPRRQAVLGFNVTIDPPRTAEDSVAVTEITLDLDKSPCNGSDCLSLVSLMPQEKTYNSAALTTKSNSFAGSAVVNMFSVGYSERRKGQTFYLYRDNDTVSYERMDASHPNRIVFGWMFRPVLGRRSVSPGLRQLFAIVSLPSSDRNGGTEEVTNINASVETYWKKYDRRTMTSYKDEDTNRASRIRRHLTFGLTRPEIFDGRYVNTAEYKNVSIQPTETYQDSLRPELKKVSWRFTGPKNVLVSVEGDNFFTGTQVAINDKNFTSVSEGLTLKSNQAFDLATSLDALASGPGIISGRYGPAIPMILKESAAGVPSGRLTIDRIDLGPAESGIRTLTVRIRRVVERTKPITFDVFPSSLTGLTVPIVSVNGTAVQFPYQIVPGTTDLEDSDLAETLEEKVALLNSFETGTEPLLVGLRNAMPNVLKSIHEFSNVQSTYDRSKTELVAISDTNAETKKAAREKTERLRIETESKANRAFSDLKSALNTQLDRKDFYQQDLFPNVPLSEEVERFLKSPNDDNKLRTINRLLLERVLPYNVKTRATITVNAPDSAFIKDGGLIRVTYPFLPPNWTATEVHSTTANKLEITRLADNGILLWLKDSSGFVIDPLGPEYEPTSDFCWQLFIPGGGNRKLKTKACPAGTESESLSSNAVTVTLGTGTIPDRILLVSPYGAVFPLEVPKLESKKPEVKPIVVNQNDRVWIDIPLKEFPENEKKKFLSVGIGDLIFPNVPPKPNAKMVKVFVDRVVTEKPGDLDLTVRYEDNVSDIVRMTVVKQPKHGEKEK
jgi:hypothetical protein